MTELEPPELAVRLAILRTRARHDGITSVSDEVLEEIAARVTSSARALEGALVRVIAYASLRGEQPSAAMARHVLNHLLPAATTRTPTIDEVVAATGEEFGLETSVVVAHDRHRAHVWARQVAMYLARELTEESLPAIGAQRRWATTLDRAQRPSRRRAPHPRPRRPRRHGAGPARAARRTAMTTVALATIDRLPSAPAPLDTAAGAAIIDVAHTVNSPYYLRSSP